MTIKKAGIFKVKSDNKNNIKNLQLPVLIDNNNLTLKIN